LLDEAVRAWPKLRSKPADFVGRLDLAMAGEDFEDRHVADLYLAWACSLGDEKAMASLDPILRVEVTAAASRVDPSTTFVEEVVQLVRDKLLVRDGSAEPKIGEYAAKGPLRKWLRAAALRTAINHAGSRGREAAAVEGMTDQASNVEDDPETAYMRARYRSEFKAAFREAFEALSEQDRNVLRLNTVKGESIDDIARVYRVHRATVARWIDRCRDQLFRETRRLLARRSNLRGEDLDSLIRFIRSEIDLSLHRSRSQKRRG
jgi:RNA polymerase sigma-70 factor (ECF subfamily)